ncbi:DUF3772 domain-containing protein, partial [Pseudomonas aeruginosa]
MTRWRIRSSFALGWSRLASSARAAGASRSTAACGAALAEDASLDQLNAQLDRIRQRVTADASDDLLAELRQSALQVQRQADALLALRVADIERLDD